MASERSVRRGRRDARTPAPARPAPGLGRAPAARSRLAAVLQRGDALPERVERGLCAVVEAELREDLRQAVPDGLLADPQPGRDLLVGGALGEVPEDLLLALGQLAQLVLGVRRQLAVLAELGQYLRCHLRVQ